MDFSNLPKHVKVLSFHTSPPGNAGDRDGGYILAHIGTAVEPAYVVAYFRDGDSEWSGGSYLTGDFLNDSAYARALRRFVQVADLNPLVTP